jgi:hypothetical protein
MLARARVITLIFAITTLCSADSLTLRSGRVVHGQYLGGDARQIKMAIGDRVETFDIADVTNLQFGGGEKLSSDDSRLAPLPPPPPPPDAPPQQQQTAPPLQPQSPAYGAPPQQSAASYPSSSNSASYPPSTTSYPPSTTSGMQIPSGTTITVRMIDGVDSEQSRLGQTYRASVDEPVIVNGQTIISRGSDCVARLVEDQDSGKFAGRTILKLDLQQVMVNGKMIDVTTGDVTQASSSRGARTAKVVGGTTALGAIIGALGGGGKGAAIGAASGAAVGGAAEVLTKGQRVKIPSETRLSFTLQQPANL